MDTMHATYKDADGARRPIEQPSYLVTQARHAEHMNRHHEAAGWWFAAAGAAQNQADRARFIRLYELANARSLAGAA